MQPKPTSTLKRQGTYQACRHAGRVDNAEWPAIDTEAPAHLDADGAAIWKSITEAVPDGVLSQADALLLEGLCEWLPLWRQFSTASKKAGKSQYRALVMACASWKQVCTILAKLGLSPVDRARIKSIGGTNEVDPLVELLKRRHGSN